MEDVYDRRGMINYDISYIEDVAITPFQGFWYIMCDYLTPRDMRKLMSALDCSMCMGETNRVGLLLKTTQTGDDDQELYIDPISPKTSAAYLYAFRHYYQFSSIHINSTERLIMETIDIGGNEELLKKLISGGRLVMSEHYRLMLSYALKDIEAFESSYSKISESIERYFRDDYGLTSRMVRHALVPIVEKLSNMKREIYSQS